MTLTQLPWWWAYLAAPFAAGLLLAVFGAWAFWPDKDKENDSETLLPLPEEDLARSRSREDRDAVGRAVVDRPLDLQAVSAPVGRGPAAADAGDWRDTMTRELDPARLDLEAAEQYLPGPEQTESGHESASLRAGELHPRIIDLGQTGDDKMLTRDWFARRDWVASLWDPRWGGFELTDSGHLVAVAA